MTDNTQPEALRLAHIFDHPIPPNWPDMVAAAAELRRQHTRISELEAQLEAVGAGGVQALSAAPAEQQVASSAVLKAIREANMQLVHTGDDAFMLVPYKRATAEQQAAPKAAPGEPSDAEIDAFLDSPAGITWVIASTRERYRLLVRAVLAKWGTQPQAGAVPQGWKAVPVNPTPEMWKAAKTVPDPNPPYPPHYGLVWDAMLAASPTPPAEQQATKETSGGFHVWRDISTAPKDGSRFVATGHNYGLYSEVRHTCVAQWFRGCWMEASDWNETSELKYLTHWMPLPSPPDDVAAPAEQQAAPKAAPVVDKCTKQQMTTEVLRRMQQQEDGHNKNPFRSLLDRLMRNEGGYSTIEIGQLKYALDGFYGAARAQAADSVTAPAATVIKKGVDRQWMSERLGHLPDGIYSLYLAPQQEAQDAAFEAVRKKLCALPRYSFVLDDDGLVRRVQDRIGNWIEFDAAHELFDPVAVDAALAAQGGK